MSTNPQRRRLLGLLAATPLPAAAGTARGPAGPNVLSRLSPGFAGYRSFSAPMRRRLYAELPMREAEPLAP